MEKRRAAKAQTSSKTSPARRAPERAPSLGPEAWIAAAWQVIAREGVAGVRIEPLAVTLGVTKGSFYWHFTDRAALLDALLVDWERRGTLAVIEHVNKSASDARVRLETLFRYTTAVPDAAGVEHAVRAWGASDAKVRLLLAKVDEQRERYVAEQLVAAGVPEDRAAMRARALYLALIGEYTRVAHGARQTPRAAWDELLVLVLDERARGARSR